MINVALYRRLLALPGRARLTFWGFVARLPNGMNGLALTAATQHITGRFDVAGLVSACFFLASAMSAPVLGRIIDQRGPHRMYPILTMIYAGAMLGFAALSASSPAWMFAGLAFTAGASIPSVGTLMRAMWMKSSLSDVEKRAGYSIEGMITEVVFMLGPLLVSLTLALGSPRMVTVFNALFCVMGTIGFFRAGGLSQWGRVEEHVERHWLGPMQTPSFVLMVFAALCAGLAFGCNEMVFFAFVKSIGSPALVGWLYFSLCLTSALGTLWFGSYITQRPLKIMLIGFAMYTAVFFALMAFVVQFYVMIGVAFLAGIFVGAYISGAFGLAARITPTRYATEASNWVSSMLMSGLGFGFALSGFVLQKASWQTLALLSAVPFVLASIALTRVK